MRVREVPVLEDLSLLGTVQSGQGISGYADADPRYSGHEVEAIAILSHPEGSSRPILRYAGRSVAALPPKH